jgi:uncharacterized protein YjbJ (UPF0337 family)
MKSLPWIIALAGLGAAAYVILNTPRPEYATGSDTIEGAATDTSHWGSKTRLRGAGGKFVGKAKQAFGNATGNPDLADEGAGQEIAGAVKDGAGALAQAAGQAIHDLNR